MAASASLVPDIGGKVRRYMTSNNKYSDAPEDIEKALDVGMVMEDFLPSPAELVRRSEKERITIAVDKHSLDLFKRYAKDHDAKYQTMMNGVLGAYADKFLKRK
jgi:uncharacterized protein (DUF4415 family)